MHEARINHDSNLLSLIPKREASYGCSGPQPRWSLYAFPGVGYLAHCRNLCARLASRDYAEQQAGVAVARVRQGPHARPIPATREGEGAYQIGFAIATKARVPLAANRSWDAEGVAEYTFARFA